MLEWYDFGFNDLISSVVVDGKKVDYYIFSGYGDKYFLIEKINNYPNNSRTVNSFEHGKEVAQELFENLKRKLENN